MLRRKTYTQKLKLLPFFILVTLFVIYQIAIRETIKVRDDCKKLEEEARIADDAPRQIVMLQQKLDALSAIAGDDTLISQTDPLLEFISINMPKHVKLEEFQPTHIYQHQKYKIETRIVVMDGKFTNLLKMMFQLEKKYRKGKIVSAKFETETDFKTDSRRLLMSLYVQSVKNNDSININNEINKPSNPI